MTVAVAFAAPSQKAAVILSRYPDRGPRYLDKSRFIFDAKSRLVIAGCSGASTRKNPDISKAKFVPLGRLVPVVLRCAPGEIGHQGFGIAGKVIGYRNEIFDREHDVYREVKTRVDERYLDHDAIVGLQKPERDFANRPNSQFLHVLSLSDGVPSIAICDRAGGASSPARKGTGQ